MATTATSPEMINAFKQMVREEWDDKRTVEAWRRWRTQFRVQTAEVTRLILQAAEIAPGMQVLDIASGTGEPLRSVAKIVGPAGHVTSTDLSASMLRVAEESATEDNLHNITYQQADAHALPFADNSFDRITCRWGVMYFGDPQQALSEIRRVLKRGGKVAFTAWGPLEENPFMIGSLGPLFKRVQVPPPPPGAPTPFKYAAHGSLTVALEGVGFKDVAEETEQVSFPWPGSPENLWEHFQDVAAPFRPIIESLSLEERKSATEEIQATYRQFYDGQQINMPAVIVVASAVK
jgi:ubiquinone/menaquinone biosynthesis C-methylase UbiE